MLSAERASRKWRFRNGANLENSFLFEDFESGREESSRVVLSMNADSSIVLLLVSDLLIGTT